MFKKLKNWIIGKVIMGKVIGKLAKHGATAIVGLISAPMFVEKIQPILDQIGITINEGNLEAGLIVLLTGAAGALWNYIAHRFIK
jgi:hypothetical protein